MNWLRAAVVCTGMAFATFVILEIARHLQWRRHRDSGYVPGTQHWCLAAVLVAAVFCGAAVVCLIMWGVSRQK
jgi:hypothetical protein